MSDVSEFMTKNRYTYGVCVMKYKEMRDNTSIFAFIENCDDTVFYYSIIRRHHPARPIHLMKCGNKREVIKAARALHNDCFSALFIVDRDHDEFIGETNQSEDAMILKFLPDDVYVTDLYSLDSNFLRTEIFISAIQCSVHIKHHSEQEYELRQQIYSDIIQRYNDAMAKMIDFTALYIYSKFMRDLDDPNYNKMTEDINALSLSKLETGFENLFKAIPDLYQRDDYLTLHQEIKSNPLKYISAKPFCKYMVQLFKGAVQKMETRLSNVIQGASNKNQKPITCVIQLEASNYAHSLAVYVQPPQTFLDYMSERLRSSGDLNRD